jgi:hypothetical protein
MNHQDSNPGQFSRTFLFFYALTITFQICTKFVTFIPSLSKCLKGHDRQVCGVLCGLSMPFHFRDKCKRRRFSTDTKQCIINNRATQVISNTRYRWLNHQVARCHCTLRVLLNDCTVQYSRITLWRPLDCTEEEDNKGSGGNTIHWAQTWAVFSKLMKVDRLYPKNDWCML